MDLKSIDAVNAYAQALKPKGAGSAGGLGKGTDSFANALGEVLEGAMATAGKAEAVSMQALSKETEMIDVVTAVTNAELVVESVVAVRDKVIQAYNDIIRMPM